jgi:hypothetical protein
MKKVLSLVLVIAMVLSSMSFAFASTSFTDIADTNYEKAIDTLVGLGVITGYEDGTFRPEKTITRAEMAKILVVALGYGDLVAGSKSNFSDTQGHWADAYIGLAAGKGLVVGTGNGKFTPDATVTYDAALTMIVRGLGYTDTCNEIKGTWPSNFKVKAAELGITKNVAINATGADRGGVAKVLANALECTLVTVDTDGNVVKIVDTTDGEKSDRILLSRLADKKTIEVAPEMLDKSSKKYVGDKVDVAPYMFQSLTVYVDYTDKDADRYEIVYIKKNNSVVLEGTVSDILSAGGKSATGSTGVNVNATEKATIVVEDANEKEFDMVIPAGKSLKAFYNGEEETIKVEDLEKLLYDNEEAKITVIVDDAKSNSGNGNDNGKADDGESPIAVIVEKATSGIQVETAYNGKLKITGVKGSITLPENNSKADLDNITVIGAVDSLEDIKVDDIVTVFESISGDVTKLAVARNTVSGTVTKTNSDATTVYVDGVKYSVSDVKNTVGANAIEAGDEGIFYLDNAGEIFAADTDGSDLTDYAVVIDGANGKAETGFASSYGVDKYPQLKLLTQSGDETTYKIKTSFDGIVLDDKATLNDSTHYLISLSGTAIEIDPTVTKGKLIRYSVNSDGYIDEVEVVANSTEKIDDDKIDENTTKDTAVFYHDTKNTATTTDDEYDVVSLSSVNDGTAQVAYYKSGSNKGKIAAILTVYAQSENDDKYGVIKSVSYTTNAKGDKVVEVTALVDGAEVKFLTEKGKTIKGTFGDYVLNRTTTSTAVQFKLNSSDVLLSLKAIVDDNTNTNIYNNADIKDIDNQEITLTNNTTLYYTSDCAVYIYDDSDDAITIGDKSDIDDNAISTTAYSFDGSSRISVIVQVVK